MTKLVPTDESSSLASTSSDIKATEVGKDALPLKVLNNYFSIGADAKIALDFHSARGIFQMEKAYHNS